MKNSLFLEYTQAANPVGRTIPLVPCVEFASELYKNGPTRNIPLDTAEKLGLSTAATSPALLANFVRILEGESITPSVNATSQLFYVIEGKGRTTLRTHEISWGKGDFLTLPAGTAATHHAQLNSSLYWVHDEPLLTYLGATATQPRFEPTLFSGKEAQEELQKVWDAPGSAKRNRISVILANTAFPQTQTITHTLWAMLGILPQGQVQPPHRHQSIALDFIVDCEPGCYTTVGSALDDQGRVRNGRRIEWKPGSVFITPPGLWHSHHNESGRNAFLIPVQDAGLHTYLRTLDIRF